MVVVETNNPLTLHLKANYCRMYSSFYLSDNLVGLENNYYKDNIYLWLHHNSIVVETIKTGSPKIVEATYIFSVPHVNPKTWFPELLPKGGYCFIVPKNEYGYNLITLEKYFKPHENFKELNYQFLPAYKDMYEIIYISNFFVMLLICEELSINMPPRASHPLALYLKTDYYNLYSFLFT